MIYGYARVSTTEQNLDRQLDAFKNSGLEINKIVCEKQSGKDFNSRIKYMQLRKSLKKGDLLVILSIDRLGRNYQQILDEWRYLTERKKVDIQVLDMPLLNTQNGVDGLDGKFISNLVLTILAYVSQKERETSKIRQAQGIKSAKAKGVKFGRPSITLPDNFDEIAQQYIFNKITNIQACEKLGLSRGTFFRYLQKRSFGLKTKTSQKHLRNLKYKIKFLDKETDLLTRKEVLSELGISSPTLRRYFNGENTIINAMEIIVKKVVE